MHSCGTSWAIVWCTPWKVIFSILHLSSLAPIYVQRAKRRLAVRCCRVSRTGKILVSIRSKFLIIIYYLFTAFDLLKYFDIFDVHSNHGWARALLAHSLALWNDHTRYVVLWHCHKFFIILNDDEFTRRPLFSIFTILFLVFCFVRALNFSSVTFSLSRCFWAIHSLALG